MGFPVHSMLLDVLVASVIYEIQVGLDHIRLLSGDVLASAVRRVPLIVWDAMP